MLAQYYSQKDGRTADFEFEGLTKIYQNMQTVNCAIARRLREATANDSSVNAIVILDSFAQIVPFAIEESLGIALFVFTAFAKKNLTNVYRLPKPIQTICNPFQFHLYETYQKN
jgi:hypothetical protein